MAMTPRTPGGWGDSLVEANVWLRDGHLLGHRVRAVDWDIAVARRKRLAVGGREGSSTRANESERVVWRNPFVLEVEEWVRMAVVFGVPSPAMWIVGTAEYQVGCGSAASAALNFSAEKESRHVMEPPEASVARTDAERPPMWKSGMALRHTSFSEISIVPESSRPFRTIAPCRSRTPFGFDVVPDVRKSSTTSSSPVSSGFKSYSV
eukprot:scaffold42267_cov66-Phaeocystis_antarctica.AAC.5